MTMGRMGDRVGSVVHPKGQQVDHQRREAKSTVDLVPSPDYFFSSRSRIRFQHSGSGSNWNRRKDPSGQVGG